MSDSENSDTETSNNTPKSQPNSMNFPTEFAAQFAEFLKQSLKIPDKPESSSSPKSPTKSDQPESFGEVTIKAKLNGENYPLWVNLMKRAIVGKGLSSHINGVSKPPSIDDPAYTRWEQRDNCVFNWVINNLETGLVNEVSQYATAADLWEGLAITYGSGSDPFQIYDLHRQAMTVKQETMTLEGLWTKMQDLWISIDTRDPSPTDIEGYRKKEERHRLYQFLSALDDKYANIKREIMDKDPLPTVRKAYGLVRRQATNEGILKPSEPPTTRIGSGLAAVNHNRTPPPSNRPPPHGNQAWNNRKGEEDKSKLVCSHCGGKKHTKEGCFLLIGFPEWWDEMKKARAASRGRNQPWNRSGQAAVAVSSGNPTWNQGGNSVTTVGGGNPAWTQGGQVVTAGGAWKGGENRAANTNTLAGSVGPPLPQQNRDVEERGGALAARVFGGNEGLNHFSPSQCIISCFLPSITCISEIEPLDSHKLHQKPHQDYLSHQTPHAAPKLHIEPLNLPEFEKEDPDNKKQFFEPNISCRNSFQALALSSTNSETRDKDHNWIFDCGATDTMSFDVSDFLEIVHTPKKYIKTASGNLAYVQGAGTIKLSPELSLSNCLYVPSLSHKLVSVSHVTRELHCNLLMQPGFCILQDTKTGKIVGRGTEHQGLYYVDGITNQGTAMLTQGLTEDQTWLWHRRLGHPSIGYLRLLYPNSVSPHPLNCETCFLAKSHRHSFKLNNTRVKSIFSLIHTDVWGPAPVTSENGFRYFLLFVDDCSRMTWVYFLKSKSEVFEKFTQFYSLVQTQYKQNIQILRSDNGGEYVNSKMEEFFTEKGLIHQTSCPYTPEQNGVAERKNRIVLEMTRALIIDSHIPKSFWPEAVATSVYLINRLPTHILNFKPPLEFLATHSDIPSSLTLEPRVFGCTVYVHIPKQNRSKFSPNAVKCVFLGYGKNQKGYRCYDPKANHLHTTMNCDFVETEYFFHQLRSQGERRENIDSLSWLHTSSSLPIPSASSSLPIPSASSVLMPMPKSGSNEKESVTTTEPSVPHVQFEMSSDATQQSSPSPNPEVSHNSSQVNTNNERQGNSEGGEGERTEDDQATEQYILPHRSTRGKPPKRYSPDWQGRKTRYSIANLAQGHLTEMARAFEAALYEEEDIPQTVEEARRHKHWREAMKKEMDALIKNGTWEKCLLPEGKRPVGCRWVFTIKRRADGSIERYKARLVAKGYTQTYGIDYEETFSPVAKMSTIRTLLAVAACKEWPLHQFDVTNAFLHGELKKNEEVYMEVPPGYSREFGEGQVCRLRKTLYGLKQSPRVWFGRFCQAMTKYGYKQSNADHTLFLKRKGGKVTCLIIYVDDMIITGDDVEEIESLKKSLFQEFEMKELGALKYFLGIEILRSQKGIFLRQKKYILDLLAETGLLECKPAETPMMLNHGLKIVDGADLADREKYQRLVGKLIYLSHTRPDIAYAVGVVSQFMHKPQKDHMEAALRIVRYLKGTTGYGVMLEKGEHLEVDGYTDADWASNPNDRKSTAGYFTFVGGNLVTWRSKKQKVVALSSAEAEFRGVKSGITEIMWLRRLLTEIGFPPTKGSRLYCDNKAAISISENPVQHDRTKHVEVDRHFIKEKIDGGIIELPFVRSEEQLADILTKAVNTKVFNEVLDKLSIGDAVT